MPSPYRNLFQGALNAVNAKRSRMIARRLHQELQELEEPLTQEQQQQDNSPSTPAFRNLLAELDAEDDATDSTSGNREPERKRPALLINASPTRNLFAELEAEAIVNETIEDDDEIHSASKKEATGIPPPEILLQQTQTTLSPISEEINLDWIDDTDDDDDEEEKHDGKQDDHNEEVIATESNRGTQTWSNHVNNTQSHSLEEKARCMVNRISEKFVPSPREDELLGNAIEGLRRFNNSVIMKWEQREKKKKDKEKRKLIKAALGIPTDSDDESTASNTSSDSLETTGNQPNNLDGLKTGLRPTSTGGIRKAPTEEIAAFLKSVNKRILAMAHAYKRDMHEDTKSQEIRQLEEELREARNNNTIVVPTDKTGSYRAMDLNEYINQMTTHLLANGKIVPRNRIIQAHKQAENFVLTLEDLLSENELRYLNQTVASKAIPTPKLLIKDHKEQDLRGQYPTRLVIPANNFIAGIPQLGYTGIKTIFDEYGIQYMAKTITQASDLKEELEKLHLKKGEVTIASIDATDFYPSVRFKLIRKAVAEFARDLPQVEKAKIQRCLEMIKFGMSSTFIRFQDKYYEYDIADNPEEKGLAIGSYESAWLADLAGAYILKKSQALFRDTHYHGAYRDDWIAIFKGKRSHRQMEQWMKGFQQRVNTLVNGDYMQFTNVMWSPDETTDITTRSSKVKITNANVFPYLDMEMKWNQSGDLCFGVHVKPNQQIQYLNKGSMHTKACTKAIPEGVFNRLGKLTTMTEEMKTTPVDKIYPRHIHKLQQAGLIDPLVVPTMKDIEDLANSKTKPDHKEAKRQAQKDRERKIFFVVGFSRAWTTPTHQIIKEEKKKFGLEWIRVSMAHTRFSNLREVFQHDLSNKVNQDIDSLDFMNRDCNCPRDTVTGETQCGYNDKCRKRVVVYEAKCKTTGYRYIGSTHQFLKKRMQAHNNDVILCQQTGTSKTSFARHFATILQNFTPITGRLIRNSIEYSIIWQGHPISAVQTFGTSSCRLCTQEKIAILRAAKSNPTTLINKRRDLHEACKHKPQFHRFKEQGDSTDSTDDATNG